MQFYIDPLVINLHCFCADQLIPFRNICQCGWIYHCRVFIYYDLSFHISVFRRDVIVHSYFLGGHNLLQFHINPSIIDLYRICANHFVTFRNVCQRGRIHRRRISIDHDLSFCISVFRRNIVIYPNSLGTIQVNGEPVLRRISCHIPYNQRIHTVHKAVLNILQVSISPLISGNACRTGLAIQFISVESCIITEFQTHSAIIYCVLIDRLSSVDICHRCLLIDSLHTDLLAESLACKANKDNCFFRISRESFFKLVSLIARLNPSFRCLALYVCLDGYCHILIGVCVALVAVNHFRRKLCIFNALHLKADRIGRISGQVSQSNGIFHGLLVYFLPFCSIAALHFRPAFSWGNDSLIRLKGHYFLQTHLTVIRGVGNVTHKLRSFFVNIGDLNLDLYLLSAKADKCYLLFCVSSVNLLEEVFLVALSSRPAFRCLALHCAGADGYCHIPSGKICGTVSNLGDQRLRLNVFHFISVRSNCVSGQIAQSQSKFLIGCKFFRPFCSVRIFTYICPAFSRRLNRLRGLKGKGLGTIIYLTVFRRNRGACHCGSHIVNIENIGCSISFKVCNYKGILSIVTVSDLQTVRADCNFLSALSQVAAVQFDRCDKEIVGQLNGSAGLECVRSLRAQFLLFSICGKVGFRSFSLCILNIQRIVPKGASVNRHIFKSVFYCLICHCPEHVGSICSGKCTAVDCSLNVCPNKILKHSACAIRSHRLHTEVSAVDYNLGFTCRTTCKHVVCISLFFTNIVSAVNGQLNIGSYIK